ncbi:MAG TPA: DUF3105 domain-containing protein [Anaerolineae bacterium]|nr:DUF3105 domain-containing protein [Anaerolineae bacterium]
MRIDKRWSALILLAALFVACGPTADPVVVATAPPQAGSVEAGSTGSVATEATGAQPTQPAPAAASGETVVPDEGRNHVSEGEEVEYQHYPPASGSHYGVVLQYGLYEGEDVAEEYWLHNLEHGAIVILYKCDQPCPDLVRSLGDMLDLFPESKWGNNKIVIAPYHRMDAPLMAVAWNVQLPLAQFDQQALIDFYTRHVDQGPEDVP